MTEYAIVPVEQKTIRFYEDEITAVRTGDGSVFVPIKPIIERLGLNWSGQRSRLQRDPVLNAEQRMCVIHTLRRGPQETLCIPLDYLSYKMLPANRFDEAMKFLTNWHESVTQAGSPF